MSVGLDLGSKTIKIVEVEKERGGFKLLSLGIIGYQGNSVSLIKEDKEIAAMGDVLRKLHKETKISSKDVSIALPESLVFTRTIRFPLLTDQEVASAVKWEAEQYIPIPVAEAVIEHQIIDRIEEGVKPGVLVLLVATPRALVEKYIKVVQAAGLNVIGVETESLALARSLAPAQDVSLLIDFGASFTSIVITRKGSVAFSRSIPIAGEAFTRALVQGLGIQYQQAEEYKKTYGLSKDLEGKVKASLDPVFNLVIDEIKKAIHFYQTEEKGEIPKSMIVSGGTSTMPEAISTLSNLLGIEVLVGNPFAKVALDPQTAKNMQNYIPLYSIAVGLALRGD